MGEYTCFLITVLYEANESTLTCALKVKTNQLPGDCAQFPMEPENKKHLHNLLPIHVKECGPIIKVENLFEIHRVI